MTPTRNPQTTLLERPKALLRAASTAAVLGAILGGCQSAQEAPTETGPRATSASRTTPATARSSSATAKPGPRRLDATGEQPPADPTTALMNPGDEVAGSALPRRSADRTGAAASKPARATPPAPAAPSDPATAGRANWCILLASFSEGDHRSQALQARNELVVRYPALRGAQIRTIASGSAVVIGKYDSPKDPAAQAELARVKNLGSGSPKPFARVMLVRLATTPNNAPPGPNDLRSVRKDFPQGIRYTLQVAAWASLGSKELTMDQIKRSAENYAQQLRAKGFEAYYYHDFDTETSIVTVGVFGPDAYDSRSTLFAPDVEATMRKFPKSLVNGEEVLIPADPRNPKGKMVPQVPRLVEVPKV